MKHLDLELEKLEQRIAPGAIGMHNNDSRSRSHNSKSNNSRSHNSRSHNSRSNNSRSHNSRSHSRSNKY
jgi:hypothetical protein